MGQLSLERPLRPEREGCQGGIWVVSLEFRGKGWGPALGNAVLGGRLKDEAVQRLPWSEARSESSAISQQVPREAGQRSRTYPQVGCPGNQAREGFEQRKVLCVQSWLAG